MNPAQFRLLLAGPKVSRLLPFFSARGYVADACSSGEEALEYMRMAPRHVLLVELELGDILLPDMLEEVRRENLAGAVILLEDPAKSGLIVSTLIRGVDGYVATPPDELYLFRLIERQLLAQWALAQGGQAQQDPQEKARFEKAIELERAKVKELVKEIASLREDLHRAKARADAAPIPSSSVSREDIMGALEDDESGTFDPESEAAEENGAEEEEAFTASDDEDVEPFDEETDVGVLLTQARPPQAPVASKPAPDTLETANARTAPSMRAAWGAAAAGVAPSLEDRTSPAGYSPPPGLRAPAAAAAVVDDPFADIPLTRPGNTEPVTKPSIPKAAVAATVAPPRGLPKRPAPPAATVDEASESDLFLDVDEEGGEETSEMAAATQPENPAKKSNRFLLTPDED